MAEFGYHTIGSLAALFAGDAKTGSPFVLSESANVTSISAYVDNPNASNQLARWAIYTDAAGVPSVLRGVTVDTTITAGQGLGWVTLTYTGTTLSAGTYWLVQHAGITSGQARFWYDNLASAEYGQSAGSDGFADGPSDPFGAGSVIGRQHSIYATYTPLAAATASGGGSGDPTSNAPPPLWTPDPKPQIPEVAPPSLWTAATKDARK